MSERRRAAGATLTRRAFVVDLGSMATVAVPSLFARSSAGPAVRVGVSGTAATTRDARGMGLLLGAEEAAHAATLFGGSCDLVALPSGSLKGAALSGVVGDGDRTRLRADAARTDESGIPFINGYCADDDVRGSGCRRTMYHVAPSAAMCRSALAIAGAPHRASGGTAASVVAWHPSLARFGADTLNRRFLDRFGQPMTAEAWTGWMSIKIIWESALRVRSGDAAKILAGLEDRGAQFDGHKGVPLSFRAWDRQLRQPLMVVKGKTVLEVPVSGGTREDPRALLDQLGTLASESSCRVSP